MTPGDISAFVDYAQELEDATPTAGLAWLKARRDEAVALITGHGSSTYISTTVDGQTFTRTVELTALQMFALLQHAIRRFNTDEVRITFSEFSCVPH